MVFQGIRYFVLSKAPTSAIELQLDLHLQNSIDSIRSAVSAGKVSEYIYNPNYLKDYQGYRLGLSYEILDRIKAFRKGGKYIHTLEQFQAVSQLPDSTIARIASKLKFPKSFEPAPKRAERFSTPGDLNRVGQEELQHIRGIGPVLSARIVKFRKALGGFLEAEQVRDVYGLQPEVADRILKRYSIFMKPEIARIPINTASIDQLASNVYISYEMARAIIAYREENGAYNTWEDLRQIEGIPNNRIERIRLYLSLEKKLLK